MGAISRQRQAIPGKITRRRVLRGLLGGGAVTVALPFMECFLNGNGTALASGEALPTRFGTWFWGLGMNRQVFVPKKTGKDYDLPLEIASWAPVKKHVNLFTNFRVLTDGRPNLCHYTGWVGIRCGVAPNDRNTLPNESLDVTVSDAIGGGTRFRSIQLAATANPRSSYSFRSTDSINPPEVSASEFYTRVFGPEFQNPNSPNFTPDARLMTRKSVLSGVLEQSADLKKTLGKADQARMDEYFTNMRALEARLALQLQKPPPAPSCVVPKAPDHELPVGIDAELLGERHDLMTDLLVQAVACNQTNVFNMLYSESFAATTRKGYEKPHHPTTHEELADPKLGYQVLNSWFVTRAMERWAYFVNAMASVKEGDGTLLDHSLVFAHSDQELAQNHNINGIPMMTAGTGGGRVKTGLHIDGNGDPSSRVGYTAMRVMGLSMNEWGVGSMKTSQEIGEILV